MKQIITGPFGRLAYHDAGMSDTGLYPALNAPCCEFARGKKLVAANDTGGLTVLQMPRQMRRRAAVAMFGNPTKREV
ncbi:hypothetical protein [uncultured Sulfitobacter sp.]|uniref:hypothetical protein n=1 Tax=uncultured Sulfitobacter sp. TaxID=191468 RepID=UPI00263096D5|nr:hypothetical protein [uncultured Sulfitobacter sp.]